MPRTFKEGKRGSKVIRQANSYPGQVKLPPGSASVNVNEMSFENEREPLSAQPQQGRYREQTLLSSSLVSGGIPSNLTREDDTQGN